MYLVAVFEKFVQDGLLLVILDTHTFALDRTAKQNIDQQSSKHETPHLTKFEKRSY